MIRHAGLNIITGAIRSSEDQRSAYLGLRSIRRKALSDARAASGSTGIPVLTFPSPAHGPWG